MIDRSFDEDDVVETVSGGYREACGTCAATDSFWTDLDFVVRRRQGHVVGETTPNFYERKRRGELIAPTTYNRWDYIWSSSPYESQYASQTYVCGSCNSWTHHHPQQAQKLLNPVTFGGALPSMGEFSTPEIDWNPLLIEALADVAPNFDLLTTLAEAHQTVDLIVNAHKRWRGLFKQARRGGFETPKAAANAWLEWRYGWQILYLDIKNISDLLSQPFKHRIVSGQAKLRNDQKYTLERVASQYADWVPLGPNYLTRTANHNIDRKIAYRARVDVLVEPQSPNWLVSLPVTLWEKTAFSFVADWFVNIGNLLRAWSVLCHAKGLVSSISTYDEIVVDTFEDYGGTGAGIHSASGSGYGYEKYVAKTRNKGWIPLLLPSFTVKLTSKRIADAIALITTRIH